LPDIGGSGVRSGPTICGGFAAALIQVLQSEANYSFLSQSPASNVEMLANVETWRWENREPERGVSHRALRERGLVRADLNTI